jgi:hypothetical protein
MGFRSDLKTVFETGDVITQTNLYKWIENTQPLQYTKANFPTTGDTDVTYIATDENKIYRWTGSAYVEVSVGSDQLVFNTKANFPTTGDATKLYIATDENKIYRWDSSLSTPAYTAIGQQTISDVQSSDGVSLLDTTTGIAKERAFSATSIETGTASTQVDGTNLVITSPNFASGDTITLTSTGAFSDTQNYQLKSTTTGDIKAEGTATSNDQIILQVTENPTNLTCSLQQVASGENFDFSATMPTVTYSLTVASVPGEMTQATYNELDPTTKGYLTQTQADSLYATVYDEFEVTNDVQFSNSDTMELIISAPETLGLQAKDDVIVGLNVLSSIPTARLLGQKNVSYPNTYSWFAVEFDPSTMRLRIGTVNRNGGTSFTNTFLDCIVSSQGNITSISSNGFNNATRTIDYASYLGSSARVTGVQTGTIGDGTIWNYLTDVFYWLVGSSTTVNLSYLDNNKTTHVYFGDTQDIETQNNVAHIPYAKGQALIASPMYLGELAAAPSTAEKGQFFDNTTTNTEWNTISQPSTTKNIINLAIGDAVLSWDIPWSVIKGWGTNVSMLGRDITLPDGTVERNRIQFLPASQEIRFHWYHQDSTGAYVQSYSPQIYWADFESYAVGWSATQVTNTTATPMMVTFSKPDSSTLRIETSGGNNDGFIFNGYGAGFTNPISTWGDIVTVYSNVWQDSGVPFNSTDHYTYGDAVTGVVSPQNKMITADVNNPITGYAVNNWIANGISNRVHGTQQVLTNTVSNELKWEKPAGGSDAKPITPITATVALEDLQTWLDDNLNNSYLTASTETSITVTGTSMVQDIHIHDIRAGMQTDSPQIVRFTFDDPDGFIATTIRVDDCPNVRIALQHGSTATNLRSLANNLVITNSVVLVNYMTLTTSNNDTPTFFTASVANGVIALGSQFKALEPTAGSANVTANISVFNAVVIPMNAANISYMTFSSLYGGRVRIPSTFTGTVPVIGFDTFADLVVEDCRTSHANETYARNAV